MSNRLLWAALMVVVVILIIVLAIYQQGSTLPTATFTTTPTFDPIHITETKANLNCGSIYKDQAKATQCATVGGFYLGTSTFIP